MDSPTKKLGGLELRQRAPTETSGGGAGDDGASEHSEIVRLRTLLRNKDVEMTEFRGKYSLLEKLLQEARDENKGLVMQIGRQPATSLAATAMTPSYSAYYTSVKNAVSFTEAAWPSFATFRPQLVPEYLTPAQATLLEQLAAVLLRPNAAESELQDIFPPALNAAVASAIAAHGREATATGAAALPPALECRDTHTAAIVGTRKVDVMLVTRGAQSPLQLRDAVVLGELKKPSESLTSAEVLGQLTNALAYAAQQRARLGVITSGVSSATGFLCNGSTVIFITIEVNAVNGEPTKLEQTLPIPLEDCGGALLVSLTFTPPPTLGALPTFSPMGEASGRFCAATSLLGRGATAAGYRVVGTRPDCGFYKEEAVAKVSLPDPRGIRVSLDDERDVLTAVQRALQGVDTKSLRIVRLATAARVEVHGIAGASEALLLQPVGTTFFTMPVLELQRSSIDGLYNIVTAAEFCDCVRALVLLHRCGYVHRDVRVPNFYRRNEGGRRVFILGDLGAATLIDERYGVNGPLQSLAYGPLAAIEDVKEQLMYVGPNDLGSLPHSCADDFEQVARGVYAAITKMTIPHRDIDALAQVWKAVARSALLNALLHAARAAGEAVQRDVLSASHAASGGSTSASGGGVATGGIGDALVSSSGGGAAGGALARSAARSAAFEAGDAAALDVSGGGLAPLSDATKALVRAFCTLITLEYPPVLSRFPSEV